MRNWSLVPIYCLALQGSVAWGDGVGSSSTGCCRPFMECVLERNCKSICPRRPRPLRAGGSCDPTRAPRGPGIWSTAALPGRADDYHVARWLFQGKPVCKLLGLAEATALSELLLNRVAASDTCRPLAVVLQAVSGGRPSGAGTMPCFPIMPSVRGIAGWGGDGLSLSWRSGVQAGTS